jgi:hypothetical protein
MDAVDMVTFATMFTSVAAISVILRMWVYTKARTSAPDDIITSLAWFGSLGVTISLNISSFKLGVGSASL